MITLPSEIDLLVCNLMEPPDNSENLHVAPIIPIDPSVSEARYIARTVIMLIHRDQVRVSSGDKHAISSICAIFALIVVSLGSFGRVYTKSTGPRKIAYDDWVAVIAFVSSHYLVLLLAPNLLSFSASMCSTDWIYIGSFRSWTWSTLECLVRLSTKCF
jgi:hypothetical protein